MNMHSSSFKEIIHMMAWEVSGLVLIIHASIQEIQLLVRQCRMYILIVAIILLTEPGIVELAVHFMPVATWAFFKYHHVLIHNYVQHFLGARTMHVYIIIYQLQLLILGTIATEGSICLPGHSFALAICTMYMLQLRYAFKYHKSAK